MNPAALQDDTARALALGLAPSVAALNGKVFPRGAMAKWQAALAKVVAGSGRAKVLFVGDSTDAGYGSAGAGTALQSASVPSQLAKRLKALGVPAQDNSFFGTNNLPAAYSAYNPRLVRGTGWVEAGLSNYSLGAACWKCDSPNTGSLAFTISDYTDTADIYYLRGSGTGTFTVNVDGGSTLATVNTNGAFGLIKQTASFARGANHVLNMQRSAGNSIYIPIAVMYDSTVAAVEVYNAGWSGALTADIANVTNPWSSANAVAVVAPDLTIINCLINSWTLNAGTPQESIAVAMANIQTVITKAKLSGSALLVGPIPSDVSKNTVAGQQAYIAALKDLAATNNCAFVDRTLAFIDYTTANAAGLMADVAHGNAAGYAMCAQQLAGILLNPA
ncbi:GDSL-type esterase/lipase family protein [Xanthobacter flavus]|uniref:GDSL-type esterase/lipase family protein n=1 Tax=Xanthobacter flavus TaxID=281 RepID=UPI0037273F70